MRGKSTRGYVLKVAVASASIATLAACESQHPVGTVATPPQPVVDVPDANPAAAAPPEAGTVARAPDAPDAAVPAPSASVATPKPKPTGHKVGIVAHPPDHSPTVGTTAHAPDSQP